MLKKIIIIGLATLNVTTVIPHMPLYELVALTLPEVNYLKDSRLTAFVDYSEALKQLSKRQDRLAVRLRSSAKPVEAYFTISTAIVKKIEYQVRHYFYKTFKEYSKSFEKPPKLDDVIKAPDQKQITSDVVHILNKEPHIKEFIEAAISDETLEFLDPLLYDPDKNEFSFGDIEASLLNDYLNFASKAAIGLSSTSTPKENFLAPMQAALDTWQPVIEDKRYATELSTISLFYRYKALSSFFTDYAMTLREAIKSLESEPEILALRSGLIERTYTLVDCAEFIAGITSVGQRICISFKDRLFRNPSKSEQTHNMAAIQKSLQDEKSPFYTFKLTFLKQALLKPFERIVKMANREGKNLYQNLHKISRR